MAKRSPMEYALAACLVLLMAGGLAWFLMNSTLRRVQSGAGQAAEAFAQAFNARPLVTVNRTVVVQEQTPVLELVTHRQAGRHTRRWSHSRFYSTKEIALEGQFAISVGFDLKERFSVSYDTRTRQIHVVHPAPRVLAVEMGELSVEDESGWVNRISNEDRTRALNEFTAEVRQRAEKDPALMDKARGDLRDQVSRLFGQAGFEIRFQEVGSDPVHIPSLP